MKIESIFWNYDHVLSFLNNKNIFVHQNSPTVNLSAPCVLYIGQVFL